MTTLQFLPAMIKKLLQQPAFFVLVSATVLLCPTAFGQTGRTDNFPRSILKPGKLPPKNDIWVFILAGQSNMAGRGFVEPEDTIPDNRILTINKSNEIVIAKEPLHFYEPTLTGLDCGVSFARNLLNQLPASASILLVPTAVGGSSIEQWLGDSVWRQVKLLSNFTEKVKIANDVGILKGILWHQGESNANTKAGIERYPNQMADLAEVFRKISKSPDLPVLVGEIGSFSKQPQLYDQFNKNLLQFVNNDRNSALIKTGDLIHKGDSLHFDAGAQRTLGERFAIAFKSRFLTNTTKNIVYAEVGNRKLLLDLYIPSGNFNPFLIIWVHGGAWRSGSKADPPLALVSSGYALASIDFRLSTEAPFPAQIHDIKAAIRFLRGNAKKYGYHADKIVIWGSSSGGHLVSLAGTTNNDPYYEGSEGNYLKESSAVQGIIDFYGPTNFFTILSQSTPHGINVRAPALAILLGKPVEQVEDLARKASPVFQVDRGDPPILIVHGDQDIQVPVNQSLELMAAYKKLGLYYELEIVSGGGHGGDVYYTSSGDGIRWIKKFLSEVLK